MSVLGPRPAGLWLHGHTALSSGGCSSAPPLCFSSSTIHITRKCWHMLLNLCFHIAMTSAVFAGGITLTGYLLVCQAVRAPAPGSSQGGDTGTTSSASPC